jgi:hypothetical protein
MIIMFNLKSNQLSKVKQFIIYYSSKITFLYILLKAIFKLSAWTTNKQLKQLENIVTICNAV